MKKISAYLFSAYGSVAMVVPFLKNFSAQNCFIKKVVSLKGKLSLKKELQKTEELELITSISSASIHLANVSVWETAHYFVRFLGYRPNQIEISKIPRKF